MLEADISSTMLMALPRRLQRKGKMLRASLLRTVVTLAAVQPAEAEMAAALLRQVPTTP